MYRPKPTPGFLFQHLKKAITFQDLESDFQINRICMDLDLCATRSEPHAPLDVNFQGRCGRLVLTAVKMQTKHTHYGVTGHNRGTLKHGRSQAARELDGRNHFCRPPVQASTPFFPPSTPSLFPALDLRRPE
ncbi:hypothetical protein RRG08_010164 [Elysia crispata]|uniref:Uncharacterized protein n=1 Tax=Elysia crispata TaxID=231223 RepID=A0AAE1AJ99_9GAST|nr:hypothetical protein RRG08_010164 [Elysia crispata]